MQRSGNKRKYFDAFDAMRFFAFFCVFLGHLPSLSIPFLDTFQHSSGLGVKFFFTLSGFLITYLILDEKERTGKFNLKNFFIRRILKIWPLYYLMILFAYCTPVILDLLHLSSSNEGYDPNWLVSICFLENYKMIFEHQLPNVSPLGVMWSLCVEEHFYIIWGIILYFLSLKKIPVLIGSCLFIALISKFIFVLLGLETLDLFTNLDTFAYGAIPAFLLVTKKEGFENAILNIKLNHRLAIIAFAVFFVFAFHYLSLSKYVIELVFSGVFCILFILIITIVIPQQNEITVSKKNIFGKLGKYTYGLYLYHTIIISLFHQLFNRLGFRLQFTHFSILFFILTLAMVILISVVSYHTFEAKFLRLKKKF